MMAQVVCELLKSIYGLKQSSNNWNVKFTNYLRKLNFVCSDDDPLFIIMVTEA